MPNIHHTAVIGMPAQWRGKRVSTFKPEIDPTAIVGPLCVIDSGCNRATIVGANTHIMCQVHLGHGVQVGEDCELAVGTVIGGEVTIEDGVRIGMGVIIKPFLTIGKGARLGQGAIVLKDVPPFTCWAGNPARQLYDLCRSGCFRKVDQPGWECSACIGDALGEALA